MSRRTTKPTKWHKCPGWLVSSLCAQGVAEDPMFHHADSKDSDQTGRMPGLIWVFAGPTCHFVGFVMRRLISRCVKAKHACDSCGRKFDLKEYLLTHIKTHGDKQQCSAWKASVFHVDKHICKAERGDPQIQCSLCKKHFRQKRYLWEHIRYSHKKLILSARFYHLCLSLFSNYIVSNLNSDSLFVNNDEDQQLSAVNICLFHCASISCNLPRNNSSYGRYDKGNCCRAVCHKCFSVAKQYYIKECNVRRQYSDSSYYLSDRKTVLFYLNKRFSLFFVVLKSVSGTL